MTSTQSYTAAAARARQATEKSIAAWRNGVKTFADQLDQVTFPTFDLTEPVTRYFEYLERTIAINRDLAIRWTELVATASGSVREQAAKVTGIVINQTSTIADLTVKQAEKAEQIANEQAEPVDQAEREQQAHSDVAQKEQAQRVRAAEREQTKTNHKRAREPFEGLTKAELADQLAERGLPRTGNVEELIERLVSADGQ